MYSIMDAGEIFVPADYAVFVEIVWYKNCGFEKHQKMIARLGGAKTMAGVTKMIAADKKAMGETYGGLIEPTRLKGRTYRVFKTTAREEVSL